MGDKREAVKAVLTIVVAIGLLAGCVSYPRSLTDPEVCSIDSPEIDESSGLVRSRRYPGVFWTHNDSGDDARIFAITSRCELIAEFQVEGARNRDWEDIATDDDGNLYLADIGNNWNKRRNLVVYRVPEPDPFGEERVVNSDLAIPFRYANQSVFSLLWRWNFDAEALFWMDGSLSILTKNRGNRRTQWYRLPVASDEVAIAPAGSLKLYFSLAGNVTAADLHLNGRTLAVLTYRAVYLFTRDSDEEATFRKVRRIDLSACRMRMAESIAWDGDDVIVGNEHGRLFRIEGASR